MVSLLLASGSPRRRELLESFDMAVSVERPGIEERRLPSEDAASYALRNAKLKAQHVFSSHEKSPSHDCILAADTIVVVDGDVLEKPCDKEHARSMLGRLSGREHQVVTAYCLMGLLVKPGEVFTEAVTTNVVFKKLSQKEIEAYVASPEPYDKAGGYGVQALGAYLVEKITGSYTNVVGLPLTQVMRAMQSRFSLEVVVKSKQG